MGGGGAGRIGIRHEEQKIKGVVENKPLPVNSNNSPCILFLIYSENSNFLILEI